MSYEAEFDQLLNVSVTLEAFASTDGAGSSSYGAAKTVSARVEQTARKVVNREGREVVSSTAVYLKPTDSVGAAVTVGPNDRITLPAGYAPQAPPIINVERHNDEAGLHHWEVLL